MEKSRSLDQLKQFLKDRYKAHDQIERLFYPEHPLPLAECYLDLGLIEEKVLKEAKDKEGALNKPEKDLSTREHFLHDYERIQYIQRKLEVKTILQECQAPKKRIYIEGAAGAGKSTLSRFIANEWAHDQSPWNQYEWMFFIRLRDLNLVKHPADKTLLSVIDNELFEGHGNHLSPLEYQQLDAALIEHKDKVLWILDGYDELNLDIACCNWWRDLVASDYSILITSRPGASHPGAHLSKADLKINLNLAVLGFSNEQVQKYVTNFFNTEYTFDAKEGDANKCLALLKNNSNLWSLAHTPIQLELLCSSWQEFAAQPDLPLTQLYRVILECLLKRRAVSERLSFDECDPKVLYSQYAHHLTYMEYLAFLGMQSQQIVLTEQQINEAYEILTAKKLKPANFYKELKAIGIVKRYNNGKYAEFIHLTFQEFFAARYVAKAIEAFSQDNPHSLSGDDLLDFIAKTKWNNFYEVMWWFVAGLLGEKQNQQSNTIEMYELRGGDTNQAQKLKKFPKSHRRLQTLQTFFDLLLQEPRAELEAFELPLLAKCYEEAGGPNIMQKEAIKLHFQAWLNFYWTNDYAEQLQGSALQKLVQVAKNSALLINCVEFLLLKLMQNQKWYVRQAAAEEVGTIGATPALQTGLLMLLQDQDSEVRRAAANAAGALGSAASIALQQGLLQLLQDENEDVRFVAADAIDAIGVTPALQAGVLMLLQEQENGGRRATAKIMGTRKTMGASVMPTLQTDLLALLQDENEDVRFAAANAVGDLGRAANTVLQQGLLSLLQDKSSNVRRAAAKAVSAIGTAATPDLQTGLLILLQDQEWAVRHAAAAALAKTPNGLTVLCQEFFKNPPTLIPPSRLILTSRDTVQVDDHGELNYLKLCGTVLQNMAQDGNQHNLTHEHWTIGLVRKKPTPAQKNNVAANSFFTSLKGLTSHAFLLVEGVKDGVRFAQKIDLYAISEVNNSQSRGQKITIEVTNIINFSRLQQLAENSYCMVQGVPKEKVEMLMQLIKEDQAKAERREIIYNQAGDGSAALGKAKQHSCVSWCLEKWQQIGLPLKRKWYDLIVVVAPAYLPAPEEENEKKGRCLVM